MDSSSSSSSSSIISRPYMIENAEPGVVYTIETPGGPIKVAFTLKKSAYTNNEPRRHLWPDELRDLFHQAVCDLKKNKQIIEPKYIKIKMLDLSKGTELYDMTSDMTPDQMRSRWQRYQKETPIVVVTQSKNKRKR